MNKVLIFVLALLLTAAVALTIIPQFINWSSYKPAIASAIEDATGRKFTIDGDIEVSVLPKLALKVSGVRFANVSGAVSPNMLEADDVRIGVAIGDLLVGRLKFIVTLMKPVFALEVTEDGRASWDIESKIQTQSSVQLEESSKTNSQGRDVIREKSQPFDFELDSFLIKKGSLTFLDNRLGKTEKLTNLNTEISFVSLKGPFTASGEGYFRNYLLSFEIVTGKTKQKNKLPLVANLSINNVNSKIALNGSIEYSNGFPQLTGTISANTENLSDAITAFSGKKIANGFAKNASISGDLEASLNQVSLSKTKFKLGPLRATGDVKISWGNGLIGFLKLNATELDFDKLLMGLSSSEGKNAITTSSFISPYFEKVAANKKSIAVDDDSIGYPIIIPANTDFSISAKAEVIKFRSQVIRQASANMHFVNGKLNITQIGVLLPGESYAGMAGTIQFPKGKPFLNLRVQVKSKRMRSLLSLAGINHQHISPSRLQNFSLDMILLGASSKMKIHSIKASLDKTNIRGGFLLDASSKLAFGARIAVDSLDLDSYLMTGTQNNVLSAPTSNRGSEKVFKINGNLPIKRKDATKFDLNAALSHFNANIVVTVENLLFKKKRFARINADLSIVDGVVEANRLYVDDFSGVSAAISGRLFGPKSLKNSPINFNATINDSKRLFQLFGKSPPVAIKRAGRFSATGQFTGDFEDLYLKTTLKISGIEAKLRGRIKKLLSKIVFDLQAGLETPEAINLIKIFKPQYKVARSRLGSAVFNLHIVGNEDQLTLSNIDGTIDQTTIKGVASLRLDRSKPELKADMTFGNVYFSKLRSQASGGLVKSQRASRKFKSARPYVSRSKSQRSKTKFRVHPRWSRDHLDLSALQNIKADFKFRIESLRLSPTQLDKIEVEGELDESVLSLKKLKADIGRGSFSGTAKLDANPYTPRWTIDLTAENVPVSQILPELGRVRINAGPFRLGGKIGGSLSIQQLRVSSQGSSEAEIISSLNGQARLNGILNVAMSKRSQNVNNAAGVAAALFGNKIKGMGTLGRASRATNRLISHFGKSPNKVLGDFTIVNGMISTNNLQLLGRGAILLTAGKIAFAPWLVESDSQVLEAGRQGEAFVTIAAQGNMDQPKVKVGGRWLKKSGPSQTTPKTKKSKRSPGMQTQNPSRVDPRDIFKGILQP